MSWGDDHHQATGGLHQNRLGRKPPAVWLAIVGLVASLVWGGLWAAGVVHVAGNPVANNPVATNSVATNEGGGCELPPEGYANACTVRPGDCFTRPSPDAPIPRVELAPCGQPHDAQAIGAFTAPAGDWPGTSGFTADAEVRCREIAERNVDAQALQETDRLGHLAPDRASWNGGFRNVACVVYTDRPRWTGSVLRPDADLSVPTG
ncbi:septum formation family protein [Actinosynnema sp. CS-041913]|uniref:septum formation family protein n=1 Tax=Actinosynnema sp. CS-041913 TaxID=3239917 RepID=UPI003D8B1A80